MAKRKKPKSKVYNVRGPNGELQSQRFSNVEDARKWQESIRRQRQLVRAGMEAPLEFVKMTVEQYAKIFMLRRSQGQVIGMAKGRKRKPVVKGTWLGDGQRLQDYVLPEVGAWYMHAVTPEKWEEVFEKAKNAPVSMKRWEDQVQRSKFRDEVNSARIAQGKKPRTFSNYRTAPERPPKTTLSEASVNHIRAVVHRMYEDAIIERVVTRNPVALTVVRDVGPIEEKSDFWHTEAEIMTYLKGALEEGPFEFFFAIWELNLGARVNEITALKHQDLNLTALTGTISKIIDPKDGFALRERTKGKKARTFGLNQAMLDAYAAVVKVSKFTSPDDFILSDQERDVSMPISSFGLYYRHVTRCKRLGLKVIRIHDLRHSYASHFLMKGGTLRDLMERLGHANINTTMRYSHLSTEHLQKQASIFEVTIEAAPDVSKPITSSDDSDK